MNQYYVTVCIDLDAKNEEDARAIADNVVADGATLVAKATGDHIEDFYVEAVEYHN